MPIGPFLSIFRDLSNVRWSCDSCSILAFGFFDVGFVTNFQVGHIQKWIYVGGHYAVWHNVIIHLNLYMYYLRVFCCARLTVYILACHIAWYTFLPGPFCFKTAYLKTDFYFWIFCFFGIFLTSPADRDSQWLLRFSATWCFQPILFFTKTDFRFFCTPLSKDFF